VFCFRLRLGVGLELLRASIIWPLPLDCAWWLLWRRVKPVRQMCAICAPPLELAVGLDCGQKGPRNYSKAHKTAAHCTATVPKSAATSNMHTQTLAQLARRIPKMPSSSLLSSFPDPSKFITAKLNSQTTSQRDNYWVKLGMCVLTE